MRQTINTKNCTLIMKILPLEGIINIKQKAQEYLNL